MLWDTCRTLSSGVGRFVELQATPRHRFGGSDGQAQTQGLPESAAVAAGRDNFRPWRFWAVTTNFFSTAGWSCQTQQAPAQSLSSSIRRCRYHPHHCHHRHNNWQPLDSFCTLRSTVTLLARFLMKLLFRNRDRTEAEQESDTKGKSTTNLILRIPIAEARSIHSSLVVAASLPQSIPGLQCLASLAGVLLLTFPRKFLLATYQLISCRIMFFQSM